MADPRIEAVLSQINPKVKEVVAAKTNTATEHVEGSLKCSVQSPGTLKIEKDILPELDIQVKGDLIVGGSIGDSTLLVFGDVRCAGKILGGPKGRIIVHGELSASDIQNASIECGKSVQIRSSVLDSIVKCKQTIYVGLSIVGGEVLATHGICAGTIGNDSQKETRVGTGFDFKLKILLDEMNLEIAAVTAKVAQIRASVDNLENRHKNTYSGLPYYQKKLLESSAASLERLEKQVGGLSERRIKLESKIEKITGSFIEVKERIFPNTFFSIQNRYLLTKKEYPAGRYTIRNDKIIKL